jgi:hypothetical protein
MPVVSYAKLINATLSHAFYSSMLGKIKQYTKLHATRSKTCSVIPCPQKERDNTGAAETMRSIHVLSKARTKMVRLSTGQYMLYMER